MEYKLKKRHALILIFSPDKILTGTLQQILVSNNYGIRIYADQLKQLSFIEKLQPDIILIDSKALHVWEDSLLPEIKDEFPSLPLILLLHQSEKKMLMKKYQGYIDDHIFSPIKATTVLSRLKKHLGVHQSYNTNYQVGDLTINTKTLEVKRKNINIKLSPREFKLLLFLMENKGRVLTREMILSRVWGGKTDIKSRAVDVYMGYLRDKIDRGFNSRLIHTRRGFGYLLKEDTTS